MIKYLIAALLVMSFVTMGLIYVIRAQRETNALLEQRANGLEKALKSLQEARKRERATLVARAQANAKAGLLAARSRRVLRDALDGEAGWRDTRIPQTVQKALEN